MQGLNRKNKKECKETGISIKKSMGSPEIKRRSKKET